MKTTKPYDIAGEVNPNNILQSALLERHQFINDWEGGYNEASECIYDDEDFLLGLFPLNGTVNDVK